MADAAWRSSPSVSTRKSPSPPLAEGKERGGRADSWQRDSIDTAMTVDSVVDAKLADSVGHRSRPEDEDGDKQDAGSADSSPSTSDDNGSDEDLSWIEWFCSLKGNEFFCEVPEDFIMDEFNLHGLPPRVPYYDQALELLLDLEPQADEALGEQQQEMAESAAEMLYGLIHARYILTSRGLHAMQLKYEAVDFGRCHRVYCEGQPCLPVGQSDVPRHTTVNIFCPRCRDIYFPKSSRQGNIDGAFFGTTFAHLFLLTFDDLTPPKPSASGYQPRLFGFKIHANSPYYEKIPKYGNRPRGEHQLALEKLGGRSTGRERERERDYDRDREKSWGRGRGSPPSSSSRRQGRKPSPVRGGGAEPRGSRHEPNIAPHGQPDGPGPDGPRPRGSNGRSYDHEYGHRHDRDVYRGEGGEGMHEASRRPRGRDDAHDRGRSEPRGRPATASAATRSHSLSPPHLQMRRGSGGGGGGGGGEGGRGFEAAGGYHRSGGREHERGRERRSWGHDGATGRDHDARRFAGGAAGEGQTQDPYYNERQHRYGNTPGDNRYEYSPPAGGGGPGSRMARRRDHEHVSKDMDGAVGSSPGSSRGGWHHSGGSRHRGGGGGGGVSDDGRRGASDDWGHRDRREARRRSGGGGGVEGKSQLMSPPRANSGDRDRERDRERREEDGRGGSGSRNRHRREYEYEYQGNGNNYYEAAEPRHGPGHGHAGAVRERRSREPRHDDHSSASRQGPARKHAFAPPAPRGKGRSSEHGGGFNSRHDHVEGGSGGGGGGQLRAHPPEPGAAGGGQVPPSVERNGSEVG